MSMPSHLASVTPGRGMNEAKAIQRNAGILALRGLTHWWSPRACFTDAGGTTVPGDTDEVLLATDLGPAATDATATATNGLIFDADMWNGYPGWHSTDGSDDKLTAANALSAAYASAFSVYVVISFPAANADTIVPVGGTDWYLLKSAEIMGGSMGDLTDTQTDLPEIISNFGVLWMTWDGTTRRVGYNGHYLDEAATGTFGPATSVLIGALGGGGFGFNDPFGDVVICNAAHTVNESKGAVSQILATYGIHSTLTCDGNSLLMGVGSETLTKHGTCLGAILQGLRTNYVFNNYGISGQTTTQMSADQAATTLKTVLPLSDENICFLWEATNEIEAGETAADTYDNLVTYAAAMQAVGFKVIVGTVLDRAWGSSAAAKDLVRAQVNSMIRAQGLTDFEGVVEFETVAELTDSTDTDYFMTDAVHLQPDGVALAAAEIVRAVERVRRS